MELSRPRSTTYFTLYTSREAADGAPFRAVTSPLFEELLRRPYEKGMSEPILVRGSTYIRLLLRVGIKVVDE